MLESNTDKLLKAVNKTLSFYSNIPDSIHNLIEQARINNDCRYLLHQVEKFIEDKEPILKENPAQKGGKVKMAEEKVVSNTEEAEFSFQTLRGNLCLKRRLAEKFQDQIVVVEFCCGKFLKKAMGILTLIGGDFLELAGTARDLVIIDIFGEDSIIETEKALKVVIPLDRVCSVELICPPCPPCPPKKRPRHPFSESEEE